jgi:hypothetical protein
MSHTHTTKRDIVQMKMYDLLYDKVVKQLEADNIRNIFKDGTYTDRQPIGLSFTHKGLHIKLIAHVTQQ